MQFYKYKLLIIILCTIGSLFTISCKKDNDNLPLIKTLLVSNIGSTTANSGGTISWNIESDITGRGICWGSEINPTIEDNITTDGKGSGIFKSVLSKLLPNTTYYTRSYVIKNGRVIYGNPVSFKTEDVITDIDGNVYNIVRIGHQLWMAENLKTTRFVNGDAIATTVPATLNIMYDPDPVFQWAYDGLEKNAAKYGRLYTWYAVTDPRGLCPLGWHIPSDDEWTELENYLISNGYNFDGTTTGNKVALSLASPTDWNYSQDMGTLGNINYPDFRNKACFSALPSGYRNQDGRFMDKGSSCCWWSGTEDFTYNAYYRYLLSARNDLIRSSYFEFCAVSVRCIKD